MLDTKGCSILPAARILLQVGIARLHPGGSSDSALIANQGLLQDVHLDDRKLAYNFLRHLDSMQLSLTPALEAVISQCSQWLTQGQHLSANEAQRLRTREFPRLAVITSPEFWHELIVISPRKQALCCAELSKLVDVAAQLSTVRLLISKPDTRLPTFESSSANTITASLDGRIYAVSVQAVRWRH